MDERLERVWARWCARRVLHLWDAPEVVRGWLGTGEEAVRERGRAELAAMVEFEEVSAHRSASYAWSAARCAVSGGDPAYYARSATGAEALEAYPGTQGRSTHGHSDQERAKREELRAQQHARALIDTLATLLPEHGLSALRLDEALEDRWLTREVWRVVMEREVEVQVPVQHDDGTTNYRTEIVRVVADWDVVRDWAEVTP